MITGRITEIQQQPSDTRNVMGLNGQYQQIVVGKPRMTITFDVESVSEEMQRTLRNNIMNTTFQLVPIGGKIETKPKQKPMPAILSGPKGKDAGTW